MPQLILYYNLGPYSGFSTEVLLNSVARQDNYVWRGWMSALVLPDCCECKKVLARHRPLFILGSELSKTLQCVHAEA